MLAPAERGDVAERAALMTRRLEKASELIVQTVREAKQNREA